MGKLAKISGSTFIASISIYVILLSSCNNGAFDKELDRKVENLKAFSKVYGYVKYFHPSDPASEIDWASFAIYGADRVESCKNKDELIDTLTALFKPIAPSVIFSKNQPGQYNLNSITPEDIRGMQPTYWQHRGVGYGMDPQLRTPYQSSRVNGLIKKDYSHVVGKLSIEIDASKYVGKKIKYVAWAKKGDVPLEKAYLRLALEKSDGTSDLKMENITDDKWKQYEIITQIDSITTLIHLGSAIKGKGSILYDLPMLYYEENDNWVQVPLSNNDFETDVTFNENQPNKWYFEGVGYLCSVTDLEHYSGSKSIILEYSGIVEKEKGQPLFPSQPKFGETLAKEVGNGIYFQMPLVLYSNDKGTYPEPNPEGLERLKLALEETPRNPTHLNVRLGNVINTNNVFQHFYPYFDVVELNWQDELKKALANSYKDSTGMDHLITLQKFTAPLKDGHIVVSYQGDSGWLTPPITWAWIEEELVITNVLDSKIPLSVGDVVIEINGESVAAYFEEVNSRISAGTKGWLNYRAEQQSLMGEKGSELNIKVGDEDIKLIRNHYPFSSATRMSDYEKINDSVFYLNLNSIAMEDIDMLLPELAKSKSIICDLRVYPRGNHGFISYLLKEKDTSDSWMQTPQNIYPDRKETTYQNANWLLPNKKPYLGDKQIIFITKGSAISYAESYMGFIKGYKLATIIGQPTAGTNGNINRFELPGGYNIRWTGMKVIKHDGSTLHGIGFLPDIYVHRTIEGVKEGRDEYLEAAIELTRK